MQDSIPECDGGVGIWLEDLHGHSSEASIIS